MSLNFQNQESPSQPPVTEESHNSPQSEANGSVDQIRDILFGRQMSEYEARFSALEAKLVKENEKLRRTLESRIKQALDALDEERNERKLAFEKLVADLGNQYEILESARTSTEQQLLAQLESARSQVEQQIQSTSAVESRHYDRIKSLFREVAEKLEDDPPQSKP